MAKYRVSIPFAVWHTVEVEAEDEDAAIDAAMDISGLRGYVGNGSTGRLVGVTEGSIEAIDEPLDEPPVLIPQVEEIQAAKGGEG